MGAVAQRFSAGLGRMALVVNCLVMSLALAAIGCRHRRIKGRRLVPNWLRDRDSNLEPRG